MHRFIILSGLIGFSCLISHASSDSSSTNNPALTGEPEKKILATSSQKDPPPTSETNSPPAPGTESPQIKNPPPTESKVASLKTTDLKEFDQQTDAVQKLITEGLALTQLNLNYKYGSADPKNGGMDCSGTVYYLLNQAGIEDVPRDASEMYIWVWKKSRFQSVVSSSPDTFELSRLKPGDLLFWTGTYDVNRDPPVTHVMIYLGTSRLTGHRVMLGASEGRTFDSKSRYGVSVFDFVLPRAKRTSTQGEELQSRFIGYGTVPGMATNSTTALSK